MAIQIKDVGTLAQKFVTRASAAVPDYKAGIQTPKQSQSQAAIAAADTWAAAVQEAATAGRFQRGLQRAGDQKWAQNALTKGVARYPDGIRAAQNAWSTGVQPFLQLLSGLTLPARALRGSTANIQRVAEVASALHALKLTTTK